MREMTVATREVKLHHCAVLSANRWRSHRRKFCRPEIDVAAVYAICIADIGRQICIPIQSLIEEVLTMKCNCWTLNPTHLGITPGLGDWETPGHYIVDATHTISQRSTRSSAVHLKMTSDVTATMAVVFSCLLFVRFQN